MSGVVGIVRLDGAAVDAALLRRMTDSLAFRGPDIQRIWRNGSVGLGHAMLRATAEAESEIQPSSLNEEIWITADVRVDDRAGLIAKLQDAGRVCSNASADAELILNAYAVWGDTCVEHILGDFAFAIWDARRNRLFCARDHFGVKPFFYARTATSFLFSNTLNCLRLHPEISSKLNDLAIADFLMFDFNPEPATTTFKDIARLPPGHALICDQASVTVSRYWTLPVPDEIRYKRPHEYVEHFDELMSAAVGDRLRMNSAGVFMSGGLDSPVVAAYAQRIFSRRGRSTALHAYTDVFDHLIPDRERHFAGLVANGLNIPIHFLCGDAMKLYDTLDDVSFNWPEPVHCPADTSAIHPLREMASRGPIALTGFGADPALSSSLSTHFRNLLRHEKFGRATADLFSFLSAEGRFSRFYLRTRWRLLFHREGERPGFPPWINESLQTNLKLRDRWEAFDWRRDSGNLAIRPSAYSLLLSPHWPNIFELHDPGATRVPVEVRHPFFDLRLVNFLLGLPALPWCSDKELLRLAMKNQLPEEVRLRRKTPLQADPLLALLQKPESQWVDHFEPSPALLDYIVPGALPPVHGETDVWLAWVNLRPLSLNFWLRRS